MKLKSVSILAAAAFLSAALLPACKPSEKNYKAAYELAQKRDHEGLDDDIYALMKKEGMPNLVMYGADSVYVAPRESLLILWQPGSANKTVTTAPALNLVIAEYRNPANARAHAAQFMPEAPAGRPAPRKGADVVADSVPAGWDWYPMVLVRGGDEHYYVAVAHGDSVAQLLPALRLFRQKGLRTVGTPVPVVRSRR